VRNLASSLAATRENAELIDRRLIQLLTQSSDDSATLREGLIEKVENLRLQLSQEMGHERSRYQDQASDLKDQLKTHLSANHQAFEIRHGDTTKQLQESVGSNFQALSSQLNELLARNSREINARVEALSNTTDKRMQEIAGQVDQRLSVGFEKTNATFAEIVKRLALIDEAQKKITALSSEVVGLQKILDDKRSRGAFGEVQLANLIENLMPSASFALQYTLPNGRIADCVLFLPEPTGAIAIDSKFPLESYQRMTNEDSHHAVSQSAAKQFKQDIRKHIKDISERYIVADTTADGAMMFIPAEAVFAEIQANHQDLVDQAHRARVWIVSPTTLWAILNTACVILKEAARVEQIDLIQGHLNHLGKDFARFQDRMTRLASHIKQANEDMQQVQTSAKKITSHFDKIEQVELDQLRQIDD
jgi:DNA recombination protein RmuC